MKYTLNYAMRMPIREKIAKPWNNFHGITSMEYGLIFHVTRTLGNFRGIWADITSVEYGQIFHVTRIGKYYCKIL